MFQIIKQLFRAKPFFGAKPFSDVKPSHIAKPSYVDGIPFTVQIETAMACNLRCPMCPVHDSKIHMDGRHAGIMKLETYKEILRQISDKSRMIGLTIMGEPLINKHIAEFVRLGKEAGHSMGLTTNATLLDAEMSEKLLSAGLDNLTVSFDGANKETFERIRIGAKYESVIANVKTYFETRNRVNPKSKIHLNCILSDLTRTQQDSFRTMWKDIADHITFLTLDDWVGQLEIPAEFGFKPVSAADMPKPEKPPVGCHLLSDVLSISNG